MYQDATLTKEGHIATIKLNRGEKLNSISTQMRHDLRGIVDELYMDEEVRVVVLTATGRAFCVGADMELFEQQVNTPVFRASTRLLTSFYNDLEGLEKPVIAAINGLCVGGGIEMALACDLRFTADSARFGLPESNIGLVPGTGGCSRLVRQVGLGKAKELVLTGRIFSAEEARDYGLVNWVVPADQLMDKAYELAQELAAKAPQALGLAKRVLNDCTATDLQTGRVLESFAQSILLKTEDHITGVRAFRAKAKPEFVGH